MSFRVRTFNSCGFTLVEVMVALACMAIAFVALWSVHYTSLKADVRADLETGAIAAACSQLDYLRTLSFTDSQLNSSTYCPSTSGPPMAAAYTRCYLVATDSTFSWKKTVTVTISWTENAGTFGGSKVPVQRSVQMSSLLVSLN
jgi:prepilin-type N-terminal cleavage/methylation domain-containing protein